MQISITCNDQNAVDNGELDEQFQVKHEEEGDK